jgi:hypothetical protein
MRRPSYLLLLTSMALAACARGAPRQPGPPPMPPIYYGPPQPMRPPPVAPAPPGTPQTTLVGSPLPPGWAWPVNPFAGAFGLSPNTVYRPVNVAALSALRGTSPCAPVEVAPSVWITPLCEKLPSFSLSGRVAPRAGAVRGAAELPAGVDLRASGLDGPVKDQQQSGVCWSFAMSTLMDNGLRRAGRTEVFAPLHIIAHDEISILFREGKGRPLVGEASWPYDPVKACKLDGHAQNESYCMTAYKVRSGTWREDPALVAEAEQADRAGTHRFVTRHALKGKPGNPDEIATVLAEGQAIYAGFDIDMKVWGHTTPKPGGVMPDWQSTAGAGHAVVLSGYRITPTGRQFLVHNSWGPGWAEGGYAWISEAMVRDRLDDAFVVTVGDAAGAPLPHTVFPKATPAPAPTPQLPFPFPFPTPTPTPSQPSSPQASGCAAGQVRDALFGTCSSPCPSGAPPVAGVCAPGGGAAPAPQSPAPVSACPAGQLPDALTRVCSPACPSGAPRGGGICWQ